MAQITLYLDDETAEKMDRAAKDSGVSRSRWVASLIRERVATDWPAEVVALAGAWAEFPSSEEIRSGQGDDIDRETL